MGTLDIFKFAEGSAIVRRTRKANLDMTASSPISVFAVTGDVLIHVFCKVATVLTASGGTPTLALGITGQTGGMIGATDFSVLDAIGDWWITNSSSVPMTTLQGDMDKGFLVSEGKDIIVTVAGTGTVSAGNVDFIALWQALSLDGNVEPA